MFLFIIRDHDKNWISLFEKEKELLCVKTGKENIITIEPGIYFIPALIDLWRSEKKFNDMINYDLCDKYKDFGGVRIEDDVLVTTDAHRVLGKAIPKRVRDFGIKV